jgi:hypothetical protein
VSTPGYPMSLLPSTAPTVGPPASNPVRVLPSTPNVSTPEHPTDGRGSSHACIARRRTQRRGSQGNPRKSTPRTRASHASTPRYPMRVLRVRGTPPELADGRTNLLVGGAGEARAVQRGRERRPRRAGGLRPRAGELVVELGPLAPMAGRAEVKARTREYADAGGRKSRRPPT